MEVGLSLNAYILNHAIERAQEVLAFKNSTTLSRVTWESLNRTIHSPD